MNETHRRLEDEQLLKLKPQLFEECKRWWFANYKQILNNERNKRRNQSNAKINP